MNVPAVFTHPSNLAVNCGPLTPPLNRHVLVVGQCIFRPTKIRNYSYFEITTNSTYSTYNFQTFGFHTSSWILDFRSNFPIPNLSRFLDFESNFQFSRVLNFDFNFQFSRVLNFDSNFQFPYFGCPWVLNFDFNFHLSDPVVQCWESIF